MNFIKVALCNIQVKKTSVRVKDILIFKYYIIFFFLRALYVAKLYQNKWV